MEEGFHEGRDVPDDEGQDGHRKQALKDHENLRNLLVQAHDADIPHVDVIADALPENDGEVLPQPAVDASRSDLPVPQDPARQ